MKKHTEARTALTTTATTGKTDEREGADSCQKA
jgi:hypothetical protein